METSTDRLPPLPAKVPPTGVVKISIPREKIRTPSSRRPLHKEDRPLPAYLDPELKAAAAAKRAAPPPPAKEAASPTGGDMAVVESTMDAQTQHLYAAMAGVRLVSQPHKKSNIIGALASSGNK